METSLFVSVFNFQNPRNFSGVVESDIEVFVDRKILILKMLIMRYSIFDSFLEGLGFFFGILFEGIGNLFGLNPPNHDLTGKFLEEKELLSRKEKGFNLTGKRQLSTKLSFQNVLITGSTGTGKSSVVLIPSVLSMDSSLVINDPSGELHLKTSGFLSKKGYQVKVLNYTKPEISVGFNVLARAETKAQMAKVANTLVRAALKSGKENPFWNLQATNLITLHISLVKRMDPKYQNLANVRRLIQVMSGQAKLLDKIVVKYGNEAILESYKSFIAMAPNTFTSISATALAALNLFEDEQVAMVTSIDTLDLNSFRKQKVVLYVQAPTIDIKYYAPLTSVLMEQMFGHIMNEIPDRKDENIFFLLDEAASLTMPSLPITISNIRKYNSGIMLVYQDFNQVIQNFGKNDAETIRTNSFAKLYFTGQSLETARVLETTLGKYTYEDEKGIKRVRSLMTADEIRTMPIDEALLICGHHRPILTKMTPYYKNRRMRTRTIYEPVVTQGEIPLDDVQFIPLKKN